MLLYGCCVKTVKSPFRAGMKIGRTRLICVIIETQFLRDKFEGESLSSYSDLLQVGIGHFGKLRQMTQQADLERPVAVYQIERRTTLPVLP